MESSNMCEKTRMEFVVKNSRKSLLQNTLENSPFDLKVLALKQVEKTFTIDRKNLL